MDVIYNPLNNFRNITKVILNAARCNYKPAKSLNKMQPYLDQVLLTEYNLQFTFKM